MATDGSGGPHTKDKRLRPCGWGFAIVGPDGSVGAWGRGSLDYWRQTVPLSELAAVRAVVACTTGDIEVYIDSGAAVKGITKGPNHKHKYNNHFWKDFWKTVGDRRVTAHKIKAHLTRESSELNGVPGLAWAANSRADELAEEAARLAQVSPAAAAELQELDTEAGHVLDHLTAVAGQVARDAPTLYGPSSRFARRAEAKARGQRRREATQRAQELTQHRWCERFSRCLDCFRKPQKGESRTSFLSSACSKTPHQIHHSHKLAKDRGLWWCTTCGASGSKLFPASGGPAATPRPTENAHSKLWKRGFSRRI